MRVVCIVQARAGSQRLPGKVLMQVGGRPALFYVLERLKRSRLTEQVVLATTEDPADDDVARVGTACGVPVFRGDTDDVVGRYDACLQWLQSDHDVLVRGTGDNFLVCPEIVDRCIEELSAKGLDLVNPFLENSYPFGTGAEVARMETFRAVVRATAEAPPRFREHVFFYCYENRDKFRIAGLLAPPESTLPALNVSVDHPEDFERVRQFMESLSPEGRLACTAAEIVSYFRAQA